MNLSFFFSLNFNLSGLNLSAFYTFKDEKDYLPKKKKLKNHILEAVVKPVILENLVLSENFLILWTALINNRLDGWKSKLLNKAGRGDFA